jgi:putative transposase
LGTEYLRIGARRACRALAVHRAMIRYESVKPDDAPVRRRLHELAKDRPSFGAKRLHRDAAPRRTSDQSQEDAPPVCRGGAATETTAPTPAIGNSARGPDRGHLDAGALGDGLHTRCLSNGATVRVFTVVDVYTRECIALEVARSFSGSDVARLLSDTGERYGGLPPIVQCDNGSEFTSTAVDHWAYWNHVKLDLAGRGNPSTIASARRSTGA